MSKKWRGVLPRKVVMRMVRSAAKQATAAGCPKCGAQTECVQTSSMEYRDGSMIVMVMHECAVCVLMHQSIAATEGEAVAERSKVVAELARIGCVERAWVVH